MFAYGQTGTGKTYTMGTEAGQYQPATVNDCQDLVADNDNISSVDNHTVNAKDVLIIDKANTVIEDTDDVQNAEKEGSNTETDKKEKLHMENVQGLGTIAEESSENEESQLMDTTDGIDHNAACEDIATNDDISTAKEAGQIEDNVGIIPRVIKEIFSNDSNISVKVRSKIFISKDYFCIIFKLHTYNQR